MLLVARVRVFVVMLDVVCLFVCLFVTVTSFDFVLYIRI